MPIDVADILAGGAVAIAGTTVGAWLQQRYARTARQELREEETASELDRQLDVLHAAVMRDQDHAHYAAAHTQYATEVQGLAWRVGNSEVKRRVRLVGQVVVLAHMASNDDAFPPYAVLHAIDDARAAVIAIMFREPLPKATFPNYERLQQLIRGPTGRRYEALETWTAEHPAPVPWD